MEEPRDRGKKAAAAVGRREESKGRAGGEEGEKRNNYGGLKYRSKKLTAGTTGPRAGTTGEPKTCARSSARFWPTGATGLRPVPPAGAGTTGARRRYHRQGRESAQK